MSKQFKLAAKARNDVGKGASRRLRRNGEVPAIIYGGSMDPANVTLSQNQLKKVLEDDAFYTNIVDIDIEGDETQQAVLKDLQRHPFKPIVLHVDFQRVNANETLIMSIPLHLEGSELAPGVKVDHGLVSRLLTEVDVRCLPKDLPDFLVVDVSKMVLNDTLHLSDLTLPEGVEIVGLEAGTDSDQAIVTISAQKDEKDVGADAATPAAAVETVAEAKAKAKEAEDAKFAEGKK